jgi:hypothetical protein
VLSRRAIERPVSEICDLLGGGVSLHDWLGASPFSSQYGVYRSESLSRSWTARENCPYLPSHSKNLLTSSSREPL